MTIVQFTRFRTTPQREPAVLEARRASLRACRGAEPELCGAYLIRLADGEWLDIVMWAGQPGHEALDDPARAASRAAFYNQIDELLGEECGILVHREASARFSDPAGAMNSAAGTDQGLALVTSVQGTWPAFLQRAHVGVGQATSDAAFLV
jgi:hypothetical protein